MKKLIKNLKGTNVQRKLEKNRLENKAHQSRSQIKLQIKVVEH